MQAVSGEFVDAVNAMVKKPKVGLLISWKKNIDDSVKFFTLDHSYLDSFDKLKGSGDTVTFFDKYDYQDESQYAKHVTVTKKISNRPWGVIMAQATIELNNTTRRFMPGFDPDIGDYTELPDRPVKISVGLNGEFVKLFTGYTKRPDHAVVKRISTLTAFDAMTYLSGQKSELGPFVNTPMNEIIEALLDEQGFAPEQYNIEPSLQTPIALYNPNGKYVTDIFNEFCDAEAYLMHADEDGIIQGWNRLHFLGSPDPVWDFTYSNISDISQSTSSIINSAKVVSKPLKPVAWNKIYELAQATADTLVPAGGSVDIFADFMDDLGEFTAISVDTPAYVSLAAGSSSYSTNFAQDGSGPTGSSQITLSSFYNFGNRYRMTFTNSGTQPVYITNIQLFGQPAKVTAINSSIQDNDDSIGKYGLNPDNGKETYVIDSSIIQDVASANTLAWLFVNVASAAIGRYNLDNFVVPHMQIGDPINVHIADTGETKYCSIMGLTLSFGVNVNLTQTTYAEERQVHSYFRLDHSELDGAYGLAL